MHSVVTILLYMHVYNCSTIIVVSIVGEQSNVHYRADFASIPLFFLVPMVLLIYLIPSYMVSLFLWSSLLLDLVLLVFL